MNDFTTHTLHETLVKVKLYNIFQGNSLRVVLQVSWNDNVPSSLQSLTENGFLVSTTNEHGAQNFRTSYSGASVTIAEA